MRLCRSRADRAVGASAADTHRDSGGRGLCRGSSGFRHFSAFDETSHLAHLPLLLPGAAWTWPHAQFTLSALAIAALLGIITSGLAYWIHLRIVVHVTPVAAMSPMFMVPVFGVAWGHVFLGEPLSSGTYAGGALVLLASALVSGFNPWRNRWRKEVDALNPKP